MRRHMNSRPKQSPSVTDSRRPSRRGTTSGKPRSLPIAEWAASDRLGWAQACQPAQLIAPGADFGWLTEIEKDIALVMVPRSKADRLVLTERLVEAGLTLITEALEFARNDLACARGVRNGLMIALLALHPIRLKNFAVLEIGSTFREVHGRWWIALPRVTTKSRRADERAVPTLLNPAILAYLSKARL